MTGLYELFTKKAGIEKRALNGAQLISMAQTFARRGKLDRFEDLLANRAKAITKVEDARKAIENSLSTRAIQEYDLLGSAIGPAQLAYERAFFRQPMGNMRYYSKDTGTRGLYAPNPIKGAFLGPIIDTVRNLRKNLPDELERINSPAVRKAEADKWIQEFRSV